MKLNTKVREAAILGALPMLVMAVPWLWTSWVWSIYRIDTPFRRSFTVPGDFFTVEMLGLYIASFLFAQALTTAQVSYRQGILIAVLSLLFSWLIVAGFGYGSLENLGLYISMGLSFVLGGGNVVAASVIGMVIGWFALPLAKGICLGVTVCAASRWIMARPVFRAGFWKDAGLHVVGFSLAAYIYMYGFGGPLESESVLGVGWNQSRVMGLNASDAGPLEFALAFLPVFFLVPMIHLSSRLVYWAFAGRPVGTCRPARSLAIVCVAIFLVIGISTGVRFQRVDSVVAWPRSVGWKAKAWLYYPRRDLPITVAGYAWDMPRSQYSDAWDFRAGVFKHLLFYYPRSENPGQIKSTIYIKMDPLDPEQPVRDIYCGEAFRPGLTLCDEDAREAGPQAPYTVPTEWLKRKSHVMVSDQRSDIVIGVRGAKGQPLGHRSDVLVIFTADAYPGISITIGGGGMEIEDWPILAEALDEFVEQYLIPPAD